MDLASVLDSQIKSFYSNNGSSEQAKCSHKVYNSVVVPPNPTGNMTNKIFLLWKRLDFDESVNGTKFDAPNHILPLFSNLKLQSSSSMQKKAVAGKRSYLSSPQYGTQCKIAFSVVAKDSYISAKRSNSDSCSENSISIPSTTATPNANSGVMPHALQIILQQSHLTLVIFLNVI